MDTPGISTVSSRVLLGYEACQQGPAQSWIEPLEVFSD